MHLQPTKDLKALGAHFIAWTSISRSKGKFTCKYLQQHWAHPSGMSRAACLIRATASAECCPHLEESSKRGVIKPHWIAGTLQVLARLRRVLPSSPTLDEQSLKLSMPNLALTSHLSARALTSSLLCLSMRLWPDARKCIPGVLCPFVACQRQAKESNMPARPLHGILVWLLASQLRLCKGKDPYISIA